jgi:hypothetical protein
MFLILSLATFITYHGSSRSEYEGTCLSVIFRYFSNNENALKSIRQLSVHAWRDSENIHRVNTWQINKADGE